MDILEFDKHLYTLDVSEVKQYEVSKISDPSRDLDDSESRESVKCYEPDKRQLIQIAFIIWQVATHERSKKQARTSQFELAERRIIDTRKALASLLLPMFDGNRDKAKDFCVTLYRKYNPEMMKHIDGWRIISRPRSVWVDKETKGIFLCQVEGKVVVGLNPTDYVFVYNQEK